MLIHCGSKTLLGSWIPGNPMAEDSDVSADSIESPLVLRSSPPVSPLSLRPSLAPLLHVGTQSEGGPEGGGKKHAGSSTLVPHPFGLFVYFVSRYFTYNW